MYFDSVRKLGDWPIVRNIVRHELHPQKSFNKVQACADTITSRWDTRVSQNILGYGNILGTAKKHLLPPLQLLKSTTGQKWPEYSNRRWNDHKNKLKPKSEISSLGASYTAASQKAKATLLNSERRPKPKYTKRFRNSFTLRHVILSFFFKKASQRCYVSICSC